MIIGALDPASNFGWAFMDTDRPVSAIQAGVIKLPKGKVVTAVDRIFYLRRELVPLLKHHLPVFMVVEAPLMQSESTRTISIAGQIAGAATALCMAWNIRVAQVYPRTWQAILPKGDADTKARAKEMCAQLRITATNEDSRDAALIALWASRHCQEYKIMREVA